MPRFFGHYIGISFQAELLAMNLLGLLNSTLEWYPFDWTHQVEKIWELSLSQHYFLFYTNFEYWIKTILTWIVITRKIVAYIYTFLYMVNFYPILTWSRPNLLLPWLILSFFQNFILKSIVIMIFLWLWGGEKMSFIRMIEFIFVEFLSLITSAYIWYAIACSCIQLKRIERIRQIRKAIIAKYAIGYDLFSTDGSSMEISKESSYGSSLGGNRHISLPNLNEAFYRSIFSANFTDSSDNKICRSLTTLTPISSFSDSEGFISDIVHNPELTPAEKCMKMLGITDVDVINARMRVQKRMLASCPLIEEEKNNYGKMFASGQIRKSRKDEIEKIPAIKSHEFRDPSIVDYLMTKTRLSEQVYPMNDPSIEIMLTEANEKDNYSIGEQEREIECVNPDTEIGDRKTEESFIQTEKKQIVQPKMEKEFKRSQESVVDFVTNDIDKKEETKLQFVKKKEKNKVCPMKELIESRPCFPIVGKRKFKECPFKKNITSQRPLLPCFSSRRNNHFNNSEFINTEICQVEPKEDTFSKEVPKDESRVMDDYVNNELKLENNSMQSESSTNVISMREIINKGSEDYLNSKESNIETLDLSNMTKELRLEPRRNFNYIFNNQSNVIPLSNVWSTMGCLPFRQKFNFTNLYGRELQFSKSLFNPSSSQELLNRGRLITWNAPSTELLVKVPEQIMCYTGIEYKPVSIPGTSNETGFVKDKLQRLDSIDLEPIKIHRYTSIEYPESKEKLQAKKAFYVSQGVSTDSRNVTDYRDTRNDRQMSSIQTTESIDNYNYEIKRLAESTNNYNNNATENIYPKFVSQMCATSSSLDYTFNVIDVHKNNSYSNISREDSIENESCCCKNSHNQLIPESSHTLTSVQIAHSSEYERSSYSNKPPAYPKKTKKKSLHRLISVKNKIAKVSFENNKHLEHSNRWRYDVESSKRKKRVTSSMEREQLEMKALKAYNEITLLEDKREMGEKTGHMTEAIYSFVEDIKGLKMKTEPRNKRQIQEKNIDEDSSNEIEIANTADSFFEYMTSFNNDKLSKDRDEINSSKHEPSCSKLPNIKDKDAAIMLNLLDRHGSHWFKQELRRILAMQTSQVKHSEPSHYALKLDEFLTSCQNIDDTRDGHELERSSGKENISIPFEVPLSCNYLLTRSSSDTNRNVTDETKDTMILNSMESIVADLKEFAECTENIEVKEERETRTTNLTKLDESKDTEISKNDLINIEINHLSHSSTNPVPFSSCSTRTRENVESVDASNHHEEARRTRNMSLHMMNIARNIGWSLRPNGIVLTNKNLQGQSLESTSYRGSLQRDIIDDDTARMVHAAFSHKTEIIIRTFSRDSRSTLDQNNTDERSASIFDEIFNTYCLMSTVDEFVLRTNNEINVSMGDTLTLSDPQEPQNETTALNDTVQTERNFDLYVVVMENDDLSLESSSTSVDSLPGDEVVERDSSDIVSRSSETKKTNVTDPRIDFLEEEGMKDFQQPSLEMIMAFFSFLLTCYVQYLRSYLFSMSDSSNSVYTYRPCEVHSDSIFKKIFSEKSLQEQRDVLALSNSTNNEDIPPLVARSENEEANGIIEFSNEVDNDDEGSIESTNQQVSSIRDSFDTMYSRSTVESENAISVGEGSSMEDFP